MFTNSYISMMTNSVFATSATGACGTVTDVSGSKFSIRASTLYKGIASSHGMATAYCKEIGTGKLSSDSGAGGVYFGTDSTPASKNDYKLGAPITTGLSITNAGTKAILEHVEDDVYSLVSTYSVKNTTDADIHIYEIGLFLCVNHYTSGDYNVMLAREVRTEPITIPAGKSKIITYKLTFNQILNIENVE